MADEFSEEFTNEDLRDLHRLVQQAALHSYPNPERTGCPGLRILEEVAASPAPFKHPAYGHIKHCSPCLREMLDLRRVRIQAQKAAETVLGSRGNKSQSSTRSEVGARFRRQWMWASALALTVAVILAVTSLILRSRNYSGRPAIGGNNAPMATLDRTIDLFAHDTLRGAGQPAPPDSVMLPAALVRVKVILPRFSEGGKYSIAVTADQFGRNVFAKSAGPTVTEGPRKIVTVILDLRKTTPGAYFLQTTRDQDEASYYYPLKVM